MIQIRLAQNRGYADHGWLQSFHSFSFAGYHDPAHMGWGNLRVLNEDRIQPGTGFGAHSHQDMEIISYVMQGALSHRDSMGNIQTIVPGDVQRMSAGTGVVHSEHNHAQNQSTHFLQIWLKPSQRGLTPGYEQKAFSDAEKTNRLRLVASPDAAEGSVHLNADAKLYASLLRPAQDCAVTLTHTLAAARKAYVFVIQGHITLQEHQLGSGDAAMVDQMNHETQLALVADQPAEILMFDLAP